MAWTTTKDTEYGIGNLFVQHWKLTADSATLELTTGLNYIRHFQMSSNLDTNTFTVAANVTSAGTASNGKLAITGVSSGAIFYLTTYGN